METEINDEKKLFIIWQSSAQRGKPLPDGLKSEMLRYKANKYTVVILESGDGDLFGNTLALLKDNRMRMAAEEYKRSSAAEKSGSDLDGGNGTVPA